ncbi:diguanylate phosphodiesterase [Ahrensia sp. R2A130]|nr:diguanylate phosphodiesterase [Ahrensia sp. R2A130]
MDGRSVFRAVDAPGLEYLVAPGGSNALEDVYCQPIVEGRLPNIIQDTSEIELCRSMPITKVAPIGSHMSLPIHRADGSVYGMFCCLSAKPKPGLNQRDFDMMGLFA